MKIVIYEPISQIRLTELVTTIVHVPDQDVAAQSVPLSVIQAEDDIIRGTAPNAVTRVPKGSPGQVIGYDSTTGHVTAMTLASGGGSAALTNKDGTDAPSGAVVVLDDLNDQAFKGTTTQQDGRVIGVTKEAIVGNAQGQVAVGPQLATVLVQGNVARGDFIIASTTKWRGKSAGSTKPFAAVAIAVTAYAGGGAGSVVALVAVETRFGRSGGRGYMGGNVTAGVLVHKLDYTSETATATTNLPANSKNGCGVHATAYGYHARTHDGATAVYAIYRIAIATDTMTTLGAVLLHLIDIGRMGVSSDVAGYFMGGYYGGSQTFVDKLTFSTELVAGATALAAATDTGAGGMENGTTAGYITGTSTAIRKVVFATDAESTLGAVTSYNTVGAAGVTEPSTSGYITGSTTGPAVTANRLVFAGETCGAVASANLTAAKGGHSGLSSNTCGYWPGSNVPSTGTDRTTFGTQVTAAITALPASQGQASSMAFPGA
jgi:hypothetical protein